MLGFPIKMCCTYDHCCSAHARHILCQLSVPPALHPDLCLLEWTQNPAALRSEQNHHGMHTGHTLGMGQQPYSPDCILQHVDPDGHVDLESGQMTVSSSEWAVNFFCSFDVVLSTTESHVPALMLQVEPFGQQWTLSEQHTA